jgi:hypothetical protein
LPGTSDNDRREYLNDISSFANAGGGYLLFGVTENRTGDQGIPESAKGLSDINADEAIRRLESLARDGIEPRIPGVRVLPIYGFPDGPAILVYIPKSWAAPHMVKIAGASRFYSRDNRGKYRLDVYQIRSAVLQPESLAQRTRDFRYERLMRIIAAEDLPVSLQGSARTVLHFLPMSAFTPGAAVDVTRAREDLSLLPPPGLRQGSGGYANRLNFDGFVASLPNVSYVQLFRSGCIEAVEAYLLNFYAQSTVKAPLIPYPTLEREVVEQIRDYMKALKVLDVPPPFSVMLSLLRVKDFRFRFEEGQHRDVGSGIEKNDLIFPDVLIEDYNSDIAACMKPVFDTLWQANGKERSESYDNVGNWRFD